MRKLLLAATILASGAMSSGCLYAVAAPTVKGRAFVIRNEFVGSSFWNCDATNGAPVCYQTKKVAAGMGGGGGDQPPSNPPPAQGGTPND